MIQQQTTIEGRAISWAVDQAAVASMAGWARRSPAVLAADLAGMAAYFPHWLLGGARGGAPVRCGQCAAPSAPIDGAIRCVACAGPVGAEQLIWTGHLPALVRPEPAFERRRQALVRAGFAEVEAGGMAYLLVPLAVLYPAEWPNVEPVVRYSGRWLDAAGLPRASASHHLIDRGRACIFAGGQWRAQPIHAVVQQRMVNHVASLLKVMAGVRPANAFVGRIDHNPWEPTP